MRSLMIFVPRVPSDLNVMNRKTYIERLVLDAFCHCIYGFFCLLLSERTTATTTRQKTQKDNLSYCSEVNGNSLPPEFRSLSLSLRSI